MADVNESPNCAILISDLCKVYGKKKKELVALDHVNMTIHKGEFVCIVGPSGCGKSTLLNIIAGFEHPTSGLLQLNGNSIDVPGPDRGVVFQSYTLFPWLSVAQNIQYGLKLKGLSKAELEKITEDYLRKIHMERFANTLPKDLSGGMKQRVAIARTLANQPEVLLMDEPFGALDAHTKSTMQMLIREIWQSEKPTIIFITHDIEEAVFLSSKIYVMSANPGKVVEEIKTTLPPIRELKIKDTAEFISCKNYVSDILYSDEVGS